MCIFGSPKKDQVVQQTVPSPEPIAEATSIGKARKAEDEDLYGGTPDLRVARNPSLNTNGAAGSGLNLM